MNNPIRNIVYQKIKKAGNITDSSTNILLSEADFNKVLLDLDIYSLIRVTSITKDKRRIEVAREIHPNLITAIVWINYLYKSYRSVALPMLLSFAPKIRRAFFLFHIFLFHIHSTHSTGTCPWRHRRRF
jgi:hypothetical protein